MIRTQIYLPEQMHQDLLALATIHDTSLSELLRAGALKTIKKLSPHPAKAGSLSYFARPPKAHLLKSSLSSVDLIRAERN